MFAALLALNLTILAVLIIMAWSPKYGKFQGSAVNPLILFAIFSLFFNINFMVLDGRGTINIFERAFPVTSVDILNGYIYFTVLFTAAASGLIVAQITAPLHRACTIPEQPDRSDRLSSAAIFVVILVIGLISAFITLQSLVAILSGKISRQLFYLNNPILHAAYAVACPGLAIYLSHRNPLRPLSILAILATLLVLSVTGSRGIVILVGFIFLINLTIRGRRISAQWYLVMLPVLIFLLAYTRYLLRESWRFRSFSDFVEFKGGFSELFFSSGEVSMAEAITVITTNMEMFSRPPFESVLGLLMYPLPRSIFTFKPLGASGYFTETNSPMRWQMVKSELLTTGYGDLIMQFGLWAGALIIFLLAFFWLRGCLRAIRSPDVSTVIWLPFLIWWLNIFIRGSIFNLGASIWPFLAVYGTYQLLRRVRFLSVPEGLSYNEH